MKSKRDRVLSLRLTGSEYDALAADANQAGRGLSDYARERLTRRPAPAPRAVSRTGTAPLVSMVWADGTVGTTITVRAA